jgi:riboflavin kinase
MAYDTRSYALLLPMSAILLCCCRAFSESSWSTKGRAAQAVGSAILVRQRPLTFVPARRAVRRTSLQQLSQSPFGCCRQGTIGSMSGTRSRLRTHVLSSSSSSSSSFDADKVTSMQRQLGDEVRDLTGSEKNNDNKGLDGTKNHPTGDGSSTSSSSFVEHQRQVFDGMAKWFASDEAIPEDLHPTYRYLTDRIIQACCEGGDSQSGVSASRDGASAASRTLRLLDVGTGTGALIPFYQEAIQEHNRRHRRSDVLRITGVDLSPNMIAEARRKYRHLLAADSAEGDGASASSSSTVIDDLVVANILEYALPEGEDRYDAIGLNACFGNFLHPRRVMEHLATRLLRAAPVTIGDADTEEPRNAGRIFVTHPLGADFVQRLHEECADTVPHPLPAIRSWYNDLLLGLPLVLTKFETQWQSDLSSDSSDHPIYYAEIESVRYRALPNIMRMRGAVASGFGRGGKKLGFPTANLGPSSVFDIALESVDTGVYFGWARVEMDKDMGNGSQIHKAVVNVGFSPTFQEQNPVKIVEAHLILDESAKPEMEDFYDQPMRLQLIGYLRPELKFPSFPALIAQITADRNDASFALDQEPYSSFRGDPFLFATENSWVGSTGGNADASWEFLPLQPTLETLPEQSDK